MKEKKIATYPSWLFSAFFRSPSLCVQPQPGVLDIIFVGREEKWGSPHDSNLNYWHRERVSI
jgi:hypothetical protein